MGAAQSGEGSASAWPRFVTAYALLITRIEERLKAAGLPELAWYDVLWALERAPRGRLRMHELAEHTVISRSNLTLSRRSTGGRFACRQRPRLF